MLLFEITAISIFLMTVATILSHSSIGRSFHTLKLCGVALFLSSCASAPDDLEQAQQYLKERPQKLIEKAQKHKSYSQSLDRVQSKASEISVR